MMAAVKPNGPNMVFDGCVDDDNMFDFSELLHLNDPVMAKKCQEINFATPCTQESYQNLLYKETEASDILLNESVSDEPKSVDPPVYELSDSDRQLQEHGPNVGEINELAELRRIKKEPDWESRCYSNLVDRNCVDVNNDAVLPAYNRSPDSGFVSSSAVPQPSISTDPYSWSVSPAKINGEDLAGSSTPRDARSSSSMSNHSPTEERGKSGIPPDFMQRFPTQPLTDHHHGLVNPTANLHRYGKTGEAFSHLEGLAARQVQPVHWPTKMEGLCSSLSEFQETRRISTPYADLERFHDYQTRGVIDMEGSENTGIFRTSYQDDMTQYQNSVKTPVKLEGRLEVPYINHAAARLYETETRILDPYKSQGAAIFRDAESRNLDPYNPGAVRVHENTESLNLQLHKNQSAPESCEMNAECWEQETIQFKRRYSPLSLPVEPLAVPLDFSIKCDGQSQNHEEEAALVNPQLCVENPYLSYQSGARSRADDNLGDPQSAFIRYVGTVSHVPSLDGQILPEETPYSFSAAKNNVSMFTRLMERMKEEPSSVFPRVEEVYQCLESPPILQYQYSENLGIFQPTTITPNIQPEQLGRLPWRNSAMESYPAGFLGQGSMKNLSVLDLPLLNQNVTDMVPSSLGVPALNSSTQAQTGQIKKQKTRQKRMPNRYKEQQAEGVKLSKWKEKVVKTDKSCVVCGDVSSGWHYTIVACEGCKGFFRRTVTRKVEYTCKFSNNCKIDQLMRKKCQACRLAKCLAKGMKPECVINRMMKRKNVKRNSVDESNLTGSPSTSDEAGSPESILPTTGEQQSMLAPHEFECIHKLVFFQSELEHPDPADLDAIDQLMAQESSEGERILIQILEMTSLSAKLIVEFTKRLPGFSTLTQHDQIAILKGSSSECLMLRTSRSYDAASDSIIFANNLSYTMATWSMVGIDNQPLVNFCRKVNRLNMDNAEFAILTAITVFSEREKIEDKQQVEDIQLTYINLLKSYIAGDPIKQRNHFPNILNLLIDLRSLNEINRQHTLSFKSRDRRFPKLLAELWDVDLLT